MTESMVGADFTPETHRPTSEAVVCEVRYRLRRDQLPEFEEYGRCWGALIERHGGTHYGFFVPRDPPAEAGLSFPALGSAGRDDEAVALFSFPDEGAYLRYRAEIPSDPEAAAVIERFSTPPFKSYERVFLRRVEYTSVPVEQGYDR